MDTLKILREPIQFEFLKGEKEFEEHILNHIEEIIEGLGLPKILYVGRQKQLRVYGVQIIMDIVVKHVDDTVTIFEVKVPSKKHPAAATSNQMKAIGQLLLYQNIFELRTGIKPRLVLIDNKIKERTYLAFLNNQLPITLVDFQKDRVFVPYKAF